MKSINIEVRWAVVAGKDGSPYSFPNRLSPFIRENYCHPVIYRWRISSSDAAQPEAVYVGEAEDLAKRIQGVRTPGSADKKAGQTDKRLREKFDKRLAAGCTIVLEIADFEDFKFNGVILAKRELHTRFQRCACENLFILVEIAAGRELLNRLVTFEDKATRLLSKHFPETVIALGAVAVDIRSLSTTLGRPTCRSALPDQRINSGVQIGKTTSSFPDKSFHAMSPNGAEHQSRLSYESLIPATSRLSTVRKNFSTIA
ncbi:MAG: hypothetical protein WBF04_18265 [Candidatus Sulfotelmatobacter sp.]